jgi:hypothetical protein
LNPKRAAKAVDAQMFTKIAEKFKRTLSARKLMATVFWDREEVLMIEFMQQETTITKCIEKKIVGLVIQKKRHGMLTFGVMLLRIQLLALEHCWSISTWSCLSTLLTALLSLQATTTCLPTRRTGWDHGASEIMSS